jgi:hypothetical protein
MAKKIYTEKEVRKLRAKVYGECTDVNWEQVKARWMTEESTAWLLHHSQIELKFSSSRKAVAK